MSFIYKYCLWLQVHSITLYILPSLLADKNECVLGINDCNPETSLCVNTLGSYKCYCKEGFVLGADGRTCEGGRGAHSYSPNFNQSFYNLGLCMYSEALICIW